MGSKAVITLDLKKSLMVLMGIIILTNIAWLFIGLGTWTLVSNVVGIIVALFGFYAVFVENMEFMRYYGTPSAPLNPSDLYICATCVV